MNVVCSLLKASTHLDNADSYMPYWFISLSLAIVLLLLPCPLLSAITVSLIISETDANNTINKAIELEELGTTDVVFQGKQYVYWSPSIAFKQGGSEITFSFGQKDIYTGNVKILKRLKLPIEIPTLSVSSKQIDVAIHSIGDALNFLPNPPRGDVENFFMFHGIPIHKGSILDGVRFPIGDNGLAIVARDARFTGQVTDQRVIVTATVDLDLTTDKWLLARCWLKAGNGYWYKILSKNGVAYTTEFLQARVYNKTNVLGQVYSGDTKTFNPENIKAGSMSTATTLEWWGTWDGGKGGVSTTVLYFVGSLTNGNDYIQFYSNPFSFLAIEQHCEDSNWQYIDLNVNRVAD